MQTEAIIKPASNLLCGNAKHSAKINKIAATKAEIWLKNKTAIAETKKCL